MYNVKNTIWTEILDQMKEQIQSEVFYKVRYLGYRGIRFKVVDNINNVIRHYILRQICD